MHWYQTIFEFIDMRSFSNLWFWIALAVMWSMASHYVLGVPFDMLQRARKHGGQAQVDLEMMVQINVARLLHIAQVSGLWIAGIVGFMLSMLVGLGFIYGIEFAQAVFCLAAPMTLVGLISLRTARIIATTECNGETLDRRLNWHRKTVQAVGMLSLLATSMWGMWQNMQIGALG
ncbi:hypothetical protein [Rhodobacter ferrooxidans]|uniref:Component of SufBCD complex n=1 Tax=Rhodobacter ferrooxidans TaxID=371731 RepID=C8RZ38_9RHOB|nr:hypothetical protein [Rhodobacter sp. SW2]EEW25995.1 conserved hypothetical protein [Rhodobacter sp. SW2]